MEPFVFRYGDNWYKYENGYIHIRNIYGNYEQMIPVVKELSQSINNFSVPDRQNIMCAIVHGHTYGRMAGIADKVKEIKRVLCID